MPRAKKLREPQRLITAEDFTVTFGGCDEVKPALDATKYVVLKVQTDKITWYHLKGLRDSEGPSICPIN